MFSLTLIQNWFRLSINILMFYEPNECHKTSADELRNGKAIDDVQTLTK